MSQAREFDVIVLGAGPAGEVCSGRLAKAGLKVAIVEAELVGGECAFYACMPSKALLRPAQALAEARRVPGAAQAASGELDVEAVLARRDEVIHHGDDSSNLPWLQERGVEIFRGHGAISGELEVNVDGSVLRASRAIVLATGSRPAVPPVPGLSELPAWTNRAATIAPEVPRSLIVMGGGVVGVELAWAYASLGASVSLVERLPRLIADEEEFASKQVLAALQELGVEVHLGMGGSRAGRVGEQLELELDDGTLLRGAQLLLATGRQPNTDGVGLEALGIAGGDYVEVNERMRVPGHEWLYVVGDANGRVLLTHMAKYQARVAADDILGRPTELRSDGRGSPRVIFTEPQVAAVGRTLAAARDAGLRVRSLEQGVQENAGGSFVGHGAPGCARLVVDEDREVIVGATFTGVDVAEWLQAATIAVVCEIPLAELRHAVAPFPTRSEVWLRLLEQYGS